MAIGHRHAPAPWQSAGRAPPTPSVPRHRGGQASMIRRGIIIAVKNKLFLVEDDPALARVLAADLRSRGYDMECASNGDRLADRLELFRPDLVLPDVMLPGKNGDPVSQQQVVAGYAAV